eukprot:11501330-Alexandrium_andersonii.AAC.1
MLVRSRLRCLVCVGCLVGVRSLGVGVLGVARLVGVGVVLGVARLVGVGVVLGAACLVARVSPATQS